MYKVISFRVGDATGEKQLEDLLNSSPDWFIDESLATSDRFLFVLSDEPYEDD